MALRKADGTPVEVRDLAVQFADLKMATDTRPPSFSGLAEEDVEMWLRKVKRVACALEWDDARLLKQVPLFLEEFAASWWDKETQGGKKVFATWTLFEAGIKARFLPKDQAKRWKLLMRRRKQRPDEDVTTYFNEKYALCSRIDQTMPDEDIVEHLKDGLLPEYYGYLCLSKSKTPQELLQELIDIQYAERRKNGRDPYAAPRKGGGSSGRRDPRFGKETAEPSDSSDDDSKERVHSGGGR